MVNTFGEIVFTTSSTRLLTFDDLNLEASNRFTEHTGQDIPELEFTGDGLDTLTLTIKSSVFLNSDPLYIANRLNYYKQKGEPQKLILSGRVFKNKTWVITSFSEHWVTIGKWGRPLVVNFTLNLKEYSRGEKSYVETLQEYKSKEVKKILSYPKNLNFDTGVIF